MLLERTLLHIYTSWANIKPWPPFCIGRYWNPWNPNPQYYYHVSSTCTRSTQFITISYILVMTTFLVVCCPGLMTLSWELRFSILTFFWDFLHSRPWSPKTLAKKCSIHSRKLYLSQQHKFLSLEPHISIPYKQKNSTDIHFNLITTQAEILKINM